MIRTLARWWARRKYVWKIEIEAVTQDLQANLSAQRAKEKRSLATQLRKEAEDMETRVQQMAEMEEKGFWLCDNGQEFEEKPFGGCTKCEPIGDKVVPVKFIKRSEMTGQEKYKSDKGREEVETMIAEKRKLADQHETDAKGGEDTAKHFRGQAASSREVADRLRKL